jgi:hypothetical protein
MGTVLHVGTSGVPYRRTGPCGINVTWDSCAMWERVHLAPVFHVWEQSFLFEQCSMGSGVLCRSSVLSGRAVFPTGHYSRADEI